VTPILLALLAKRLSWIDQLRFEKYLRFRGMTACRLQHFRTVIMDEYALQPLDTTPIFRSHLTPTWHVLRQQRLSTT
jgi:hypothetical protein